MLDTLKDKMLSLGLSGAETTGIIQYLEASKGKTPQDIWWGLVKKYLTQEGSQYYPFSLHLLLYKTIYPEWNKLPGSAWVPDKEFMVREKNNIHLAKWIEEKGFKDYSELHRWSATKRIEFWQEITNRLGIIFDKPYTMVADFPKGIEAPHWFKDAKMNIAHSCFNAPENAVAIIEADEFGCSQTFTYRELNDLSNQVANCLQNKIGVRKGESVAIIMPMNFQAVAIYLGIIKAGGQVVSIAESFSDNEIEKRLEIAGCDLVFTQDEILRDGKKLPLLEKIMAANVSRIVFLQTITPKSTAETHDKDRNLKTRENKHKNENKDEFCIPWELFLSETEVDQRTHNQPMDIRNIENRNKSQTYFHTVSCDPMDPINILFSSGTTGEPKAIPWNHTTPIKCASDAYFHHNMTIGDRVCWPSSLGWMMGPWAIFATFINQATLLLYTGSPNGKNFGQCIQDNKVTILGVVPTIVKHWRETRCMENLNWDSIKLFTSTGECSNVEDMLYLMHLAGYRPLIEYCGGTEIGGAYITCTILQASAPTAFTTPAMGLDFVILNEKKNEDEDEKTSIKANAKSIIKNKGEIAIIPPSIGLSSQLINHDNFEVYYQAMPYLPDGARLRRHGDQAEYFSNGFYRLLGRVDDTMNLSGIKVSSAEIERVLNLHSNILETAAIAITEKDSGPEQLIVFAVLKPGAPAYDNVHILRKELQNLIKEKLNPLYKLQSLKIIEKLPRTASNKIMRRILREEYIKTRDYT